LAANRDLALLHMIFTDIAQAAGEHDRLVVAAYLFTARGFDALLEGTEIAGQRRTAEFVVERRATQRAFDHDVQRRDDALGLAIGLFPGLLEVGDVQVGNGKAGQASLGLGATAGSPFVANLTARAGSGTREWSDGGRVVVGFHLHQDVHRLLVRSIFAGRCIRIETPGLVADD